MTDFVTDIKKYTSDVNEAPVADTGIKAVVEKMKTVGHKSRVSFYYLLAETTGTLNKLS